MSRPKVSPRLRACLGAFASAAALVLVLPGIASAANYTPTNGATLTSDVALINAAGGSNTITLTAGDNYNPAATLTFTSTGTTTIIGAGESSPIGTGLLSPVPSDLIDVNAGTVVFQNVLLSGGQISPAYTINDSSAVTFDDSTIQGDAGPAFGVESGATAILNDSTIGGGQDLGIIDQGTASLFNSTVAYNLAGVDDSSGTLNLTNSIIADNSEGDCLAPISSNGGTSDKSLDSDGTCGVAAPLSHANPKLYNLGHSPVLDGGDVPIYPLQAGSAAIGAADEAQCPSTDERGFATNNPCDLGAAAYTPPVVTVPTAPIYAADPATGGVPVSFSESAAIHGGGADTITSNACTPYASGATFPDGTTTESCTATDKFGASSTKTFSVVVNPLLTANSEAGFETAVNTTNTSPGPWFISLSPGVYSPANTLSLTNTTGTVTIEASVSGPPADAVTINGSANVNYPADTLVVGPGAAVTFKGLNIGGGGGPGGYSAIDDYGSVDLENTTVAGSGGYGILVQNGAGATVRNSTIGGGFDFGIIDDGTASLYNSTVFNNSGGVDNSTGTLNLTNSIVANNGAKNCLAHASSSDHSLDSDGTCGVGALSGENPLLGAIGYDGGSTLIYAVQPGSPAIAAGDAATCTTSDEHNNVRSSPCTIGAEEYTPTTPQITVPSNITTPATSPGGATVSYSASAASPGSAIVQFGCYPTPGSLFPIGTTTVNCSAKDANGGTATKSFQVTVTPLAQSITITSTAPTGVTVGSPTYTPTATAPGGPVAITLDSTSTGCTLSGGVVSFPHAGTCVIDFNQAGNSTYLAAPQLQQSIVIGKASQTITPSTPPSSATVGGPTYTPTAVASSGLAVAITLDGTSSGCSLSSGTVSFTGAGTCVIDFNQAGNSDYLAAPQVQQSIPVGLQSQTITITSTAPTGVTVGSPTYTPTATAPGGPVAITLDSTSTGCTLSGGVVSFPHAGTCVIDFNQAGNGTYAAAPQKQQSVVIGKAAQTITTTSTPPASGTVGGATYTPTATAPGGTVAISLDSSSTGCALSGGVVSFTAAGTCVIDFNQAGNSDYLAAPQVQQSIPVVQQSQTITITSTAPSGETAGGPTYHPTATASSGLTVAITLDSSSTGCTLSGGVVSFPHAGTCVIDFNQAGNTTYAAAPQKQQPIVIGQASQTITTTSTPPASETVGGPTYTPTATASSGLAVAITLDGTSSGCSLNGGVVSFTGIGTCVIDFNQAGNSDYLPAVQKQQSIAVGLQSQTITITSTAPTGVTVGSPTYTPTATASSGLPVAISLDSSSTGCTLSSGVVSFPHAGTCVIDFNQAGNGTYGAAPQKQQSIPIGKAAQTITTTSTPPASETVGGPTYTPTATASSGLAVAITLDSSSTGCTLSAGTVSFTGAGTCVIDFNQSGNSDYNAAPQKQQSIPVGLVSQSITVTSTAPTGETAGGPTYTPTATASSGLSVAITLDSSSTGCTLSGGVVSFPHAGTCVIDFNQAGNGTYAAAPQKQQSIVIGKASQSITVTSTAPSSETVGGPTYTPTATASSGLSVAISLDSSSTGCTLSSGVVSFPHAGTCVIDFNQAGNGDYAAASQMQQSIAIGQTSQTITITSTAPSGATVGGPTYTPTATASSGLAVAVSLDGTSTGCTLSGGVVSFTAVGTCVIDFNQAGNSDYTAASQKQQSIVVGQGSQTITFTSTPPTSATVGGTYTPTATASSGLPVAITLDGTSTGCTLSGGVVSFTAAGTCVIDANQAGNANYAAAAQKQQSVTVSAAGGYPTGYHKLVIADDSLCLDVYGGSASAGAKIDQWTCNGGQNQEFQFVATSGGYGELQADYSGLYVTVLGNSTTQGVPDVVQEALSYPASQWLPMVESDGSYEFKNKVSGLCLDVTYGGSNLGQQLDQWPCHNAPGDNQDFTPGGTTKASQTITLTSTAPTGKTVGGSTYTPTATASSGLSVAITLDSSSTGCTLSGGVVSFPHAGTCVIDFNQAGNSAYNAAPQVQQSIAIGKGSQTITVTSTAPSGATAGGATYTPTATASSGLAVAVSLDATSTGCTLSGGVVSFTAVGTCVIDFNQAGNSDYTAAAQKQQSVAVGIGSQTITFTSTPPSSATVGGTYTPTAKASSGLPVAITLDATSTGCTLSGGVVTFTAAGTCVIDANQAGNANYHAAAQKQQSITVSAASTHEDDDYPHTNVTYSGSGWTHGATGCQNYDCSESFSQTAGNYAQYTFTGTGVQWIAPKSSNGGYADVYMDGVLVASNVTTYAATTSYQQVIWSDSGLAYGTHTLKIVVLGTKPAASTGYYVQIDAYIATL